MSGIKIVIWDSEAEPPSNQGYVALWRSYSHSTNDKVISIPKYVEDNAELFRKKYLAWIYRLGEAKIAKQRLIDHLLLRKGFSYWWLTLLAQKCNYSKAPHINDAIRLIAFFEWVASVGPSISHVKVVTENKALVACFRLWSAEHGVMLSQQQLPPIKKQSSFTSRLRLMLPQVLQALLWLPRHLFTTWALKGVGLKEWSQTQGRITFFSYLVNLSTQALERGQFEASYWAHLPQTLLSRGVCTNWLHLYVPDTTTPSARRAAVLLRTFNKTAQGSQHHVTLHTFLSLRIVYQTLRDWLYLASKSFFLRNPFSKSSGIDAHLWPLFSREWTRSLRGIECMSNVLNFNLVEAAVGLLPRQQKGIYLQENQAWEMGLIHSWNTFEHGSIIGAPHSTVRFWDLRYFYDSRTYTRKVSAGLPLPTSVATTGRSMLSAYLEGGYPSESLVEVEALRYLHLITETNSVGTPKANEAREDDSLTVLVLGDYWPPNTQRQMDLLVRASSTLPGIRLLVKPHPNSPINPLDYPTLEMTLTTKPIGEILGDCDVAYTSAVTSAAVDAYCSGVPVVSVLDPTALNLSPLRNCTGAVFASTPEELTRALLDLDRHSVFEARREEFFTLDPNLPRWQKLVGQD